MQAPPPPQPATATVPAPQTACSDGSRQRRLLRHRLRRWLMAGPAHAWIQTGVLVITAGWTMYTFFYKDVLIPSLQPAHLNLEATLTPVEGRQAGPGGREMSLTIRANNVSNRTVYPLANYWLVAGIDRRAQPSPSGNPEAFRLRADQALRQVSLLHAERSVEAQPGEVLAIGRLLDDSSMDPGASRSRTILIRIPATTSAVEIRAIVPLLSRDPQDLRFAGERKALEWGLGDASIQPMPMLCDPAATEAPPDRDKNCRFATGNSIETTLSNYDKQLSIMDFTTQIGLPQLNAGG